MDALINALVMGAAAFGLFLLMRWPSPAWAWRAGLLFAAYLSFDDLATALTQWLPAANLLPGAWNWEGKLASLGLALLAIAVFDLDRAAIGWQGVQRNSRSTWIAVVLLIGLSTSLGFVFQPSAPDVETVAFQLLMPGMVEELVYRGVAPALLLGALLKRGGRPGIPWRAVVATGLLFGLWHGLSVDDGVPAFDWMPAVLPLVGGFAYGWLRFHSGSLLPVVVAHAGGNLAFHLHALVPIA
jgi:membrane protease YdiL (CAAX protease family)